MDKMDDSIAGAQTHKTILVTGSGGQLGSEIRHLSSQYPGYTFIYTSHSELPVEDKNAVADFFPGIGLIIVSTVPPTRQ